jgi:hypothetical protein
MDININHKNVEAALLNLKNKTNNNIEVGGMADVIGAHS